MIYMYPQTKFIRSWLLYMMTEKLQDCENYDETTAVEGDEDSQEVVVCKRQAKKKEHTDFVTGKLSSFEKSKSCYSF